MSLCVVDVKLDESNPESKDYQFVKWLTINKVQH